MARKTVGQEGLDRIKELRALADRKGGSREEDRLRDAADDYVALQMIKRTVGTEYAGLPWLLRRTADALLRIGMLPEAIEWMLEGMLPKRRKGRRA